MKESNQQRAAKILKPYRRQLDELDTQLLKLLGKRFGIIRKVAKIKTKYDLPSFLHDRVEEVRNTRVAQGKKYGINPQFVYALYSAIIYQSCGLEDEIKTKLLQKKRSKKRK
jgi:chorismate mutase